MKKLTLFSCLSMSVVSAMGITWVYNPTSNIKQAQMLTSMSKRIDQGTVMIKKYTTMIEKAQATINQLNRVNSVLNQTQSFLTGSAINIANPMQVIENTKYILENMQQNAENIKESVSQYNAKQALQGRYLASQCPWLDYSKVVAKAKNLPFVKTGKQNTAVFKSARNFADSLSYNLTSQTDSMMGTLSGRAYALEICKQNKNQQLALQIREQEIQAKTALLNNDLQAYQQYKAVQEKLSSQLEANIQAELFARSAPLINRQIQQLESLGVEDMKYQGKFCKKITSEKGQTTCYPMKYSVERLNSELLNYKAELAKELQKAGTNKSAQAQVYANMKQKFEMLTIDYIKDIASNLTFLNETMSLISSMLARDYQEQHGYVNNVKPVAEQNAQMQRLNNQLQEAYQASLNQYGFPNSKAQSSSSSASNSSKLKIE
ncbi:hypothetical protein [Helicobacter cetorum]|uniref:hypothetical protein n=1 Tax=Helicobacter cetorum TaxID=138563 RepID=UPI000CF180FE|nr:hypothetical protein [Helicobacter cetorum]